MTTKIDPYSNELIKDYNKVVEDFGLEELDLSLFPNPNRVMRRNVVFCGQDLKVISEAIKHKKPFYALTGIMPSSEKIHFGTKVVIEMMKYFQDNGGECYVLIADLESSATRNISLEEARRIALEFHIPAYIALGLDPKKTKFYFQSENMSVIGIAFDAARKITLNEFRAAYGSAEPSRILSSVTQIGDMLYPQLKKRMPGIIPVGIDQSPHIRIGRDYVRRAKKYNLFSAIYNKFMPSLDGHYKMSKSRPEGAIEIPEETNSVCKKIRRALSGAPKTLEEHKKNGADPDKDMAFELLKQHLIEDDRELKRIHDDYESGKMTTKELKDMACEKMTEFMSEFNKKFKEAQKEVKKIEFLKS
ncbi:MAG: tryptophan--tRNA ligase [Candidatus Woesearchaeota archaeon]|nr:MAG: tryptophan--tRNA ligase [Candidatus Woesearchaeota archaeon]